MLIRDIIESIKNTAGSNTKRAILEANRSELLDLIFADTYDKSRNYFIKKYDKNWGENYLYGNVLTIDEHYSVFHDMLEVLNSRETTGNNAIALVEETIARFIVEDRPILHAILDRNLKIGIAMDSFNKVSENAIAKVECALAYNLDKVKNVNPIDGTYFASRKLDGVRCITIVDTEAQTVTPLSRQGKAFTTLDHLTAPLLEMCNEYIGKFVFDGELCAVDADGNEDFSKAVQKVTKKGVQATDIKYCIFDMIPYEVYLAEEDNRGVNFPFSERYKRLTELYYGHTYDSDIVSCITILEQERILEQSQFDAWTQKVADFGWEGFMLRKDVNYKGGRTKDLIKVKKFQDAEYIVEGVKNGTAVYNEGGMKEYDIVSAIIINHKGNLVQVGSGLSKEQRLAWFKDPSLIIGKTVTVQYFEESKNKNDDKLSLRFPVLKYVYDESRDC